MTVQQEFEKYMEASRGVNWLKELPIQQIKQKREAFFGGVILGLKFNPNDVITELMEYNQQITQRL